jgi:hypothetical protein
VAGVMERVQDLVVRGVEVHVEIDGPAR